MSFRLPQALADRLVLLAASQYLLVCSDYDGTLAPLAPRPDLAQLLPGASDVLLDLARLPHTRVAIISGRSRENLCLHSGLDEPILLVGSHGAELPAHASCAIGPQEQALLNAIESALAPICERTHGAWIERKPFGMAVHVREVAQADPHKVVAEVREKLAGWPSLHVLEGKAVIELSLSRSNKGEAVRWLRDSWNTNPGVLYLGDDVTDEAAFCALRPDDLGIKIGAGSTVATHRLESEQAALGVLQFIWQHRTSKSSNSIAALRNRGLKA